MEYRTLGKTDIKVSRICLGCWTFGGDRFWGPQEDFESIRTVHAAIDAGINFFDTAESYGEGRSEEVLGKALSGLREKVIIGTKVSPQHLSRKELIKSCEGSLRRLRTDYIDVYHIHFANPQIPIEETLSCMEYLKKQGKIRVIGVSNFGKKDLQGLLKYGRAEVNQLPYNLLWRAIEYEIIPVCTENDISITCYSPLAQGLLTGKFRSPDEVPDGRARTRHFSGKRPLARHGEEGAEEETFSTIDEIRKISEKEGISMSHLALCWLLSKKEVASVIVGARNPDQIRENAESIKIKLSQDLIEKIEGVTEKLKQKLGSNADMWESQTKSRIR